MKCPFCGKKPVLKGSLISEGFVLECKSPMNHHISAYGDTPELTYAVWIKALLPLRPWWQFWRTK